MRYCADTWFILQLFAKSEKAFSILKNVKYGKDLLLVPFIAVAETYRELSRRGTKQKDIDMFFDALFASAKIQFVSPDIEIAKESARISVSYNLPLIDAVVVSTSKLLGCIALSADSHIKSLHKKYVEVQGW